MTSGDLGFDIKSWDINQDTPRYMRQLIPKHKLKGHSKSDTGEIVFLKQK